MADPLSAAMKVASAGLEAQTHRMRVISQNVANSGVTGAAPGADPYTRKTISFSEVVDRQVGVSSVEVSKIGVDSSPYILKFDPNHVAADQDGMVKFSNVNLFMEMADMRESIRNYQANMEAAKQARNMISMTLDMIGK